MASVYEIGQRQWHCQHYGRYYLFHGFRKNPAKRTLHTWYVKHCCTLPSGADLYGHEPPQLAGIIVNNRLSA
jgi:hypothetical protein